MIPDDDVMVSRGDAASITGDAVPATPGDVAPVAPGSSASGIPGDNDPAIRSDRFAPISGDDVPLSASISTTTPGGVGGVDLWTPGDDTSIDRSDDAPSAPGDYDPAAPNVRKFVDPRR